LSLRENRFPLFRITLENEIRRLPEGKAAFCSIMTREEELLCPWQAWQ
jgi:hypothetical protein